jgi:hypothetical protein
MLHQGTVAGDIRIRQSRASNRVEAICHKEGRKRRRRLRKKRHYDPCGITPAFGGTSEFRCLTERQNWSLNLCCFEEHWTKYLIETVYQISGKPIFGNPRVPVLGKWIYTVPINPFGMNKLQMGLAEEIEIYIYNALLLGLQ